MTERQEKPDQQPTVKGSPRRKKLTPAVERALAEAADRRAAADSRAREAEKEVDGRGGLDPARYGDWEVKGIASDF